MSVVADARAYQADLARINRRAAGLILQLWRGIARGDITGSWLTVLPEAAAILVAAQTVCAELAEPYLDRVLDDQPGRYRRPNPEGYAGATAAGEPVESLLYRPVIEAKQLISLGSSAGTALRRAELSLTMYARTTAADASRLPVAAGMAPRPHAAGYYRMFQPGGCARCAILAGKFFRYNSGFNRHPRCHCVHIPVQEADDSLAFDARKAIAAGKVTGLSKAETRAILEHGADPSQVVNAKAGMYTAAGRRFTTTGTTRQGIAGARILARDIDRALGRSTTGTYTNVTFDRLKAAQYSEMFRSGTKFGRLTKTGRTQTYAYRYARTPRPTPEQILADATSREDAIRLLTNYGYIL